MTAREMHDAVLARATEADVFIGVAAVADYHVGQRQEPQAQEDGRGGARRSSCAENPDILAPVAALPNAPVLRRVSPPRPRTCASTRRRSAAQEADPAARRRTSPRRRSGATTTRSRSFDDRTASTSLARAPKIVLARQLVAHIVEHARRRSGAS